VVVNHRGSYRSRLSRIPNGTFPSPGLSSAGLELVPILESGPGDQIYLNIRLRDGPGLAILMGWRRYLSRRDPSVISAI